MATAKAQFVGAAGEYYLAYSFAARQINASMTHGNAPSVDVLASSSDGRRVVSIQVKTAANAKKMRKQQLGYEWYVGNAVIGRHSDSFIYAFLDFKGDMTGQPDVFFVPSRWVAEFVKPGWTMAMYFLPASTEIEALTKNRWDLVQGHLLGEPKALEWAVSWPKSQLIAWGTAQEAAVVIDAIPDEKTSVA